MVRGKVRNLKKCWGYLWTDQKPQIIYTHFYVLVIYIC